MLLVLTFSSCSNTKYLVDGEQLYTGNKIIIRSDTTVNKKQLKSELGQLARPKPNQTYLGTRPKLWVYNIAGNKANRGIRKWLRTKIGERPVLLSNVDPETTAAIMTNRLTSLGYFGANVKFKVITNHKKASVIYTATVSRPYTIRQVIFPSTSDNLSTAVIGQEKGCLIKKGDQYNLDKIIEERLRIDNQLKNGGFYFFNPDYILFKADTTAFNRSVVLTLTIKPETPEKAKVIYVLRDIYILPSYKLNADSIPIIADTIIIKGCYYLNTDSAYRPEAILRSVFLKRGDYYRRSNHNLTISSLMGMGVFKFASIVFKDTIINHQGVLDGHINLTAMPPLSLQVQLEAVTKSNNYTGPALTLSYKNRNLFRGAELFAINLNSNFETQLSGKQKGYFSYEFGGNVQLFVPRFVTPFTIKNQSTWFIPKTKMELGYRVLHRMQYFNMHALNINYGYIWKEDAQKEWEFTPLNINFAKLTHITPEFEKLLEQNSYLRKSFEEQFTIGGKASYTYNSLIGVEKQNQYYFNVTIDLSGNTVYLVQSLLSNYRATEAHPYKLGGYRYSQYTKLATDFRYYLRINPDHKIATRIIIGVGMPYGNSSTMPYIKQFFSGGSNSIRAFLPRSIGPGAFKIADSLVGKTLLNQAGDIKLEGNLEYRFTIISVLKGALFMDAGNVWLIRKNADLPDGEFHLKTFQSQIAVGTGFGLRVDLSFFVMRFDLGIPLRKPAQLATERWVVNKINFGNPTWRKDNLVLNIAIGYPF